MRFLFETKHLGIAFRYREASEVDEGTFVDNTGGDFDLAAREGVDAVADDRGMYFGFARA